MKGVIVDDFEANLKSNSLYIGEVSDYMDDIKNEFNSLTKNISGKSLEFLTSKVSVELDQLKKVKKKISAYQNVLRNVLLSYQREAEELTKNIRDL